MPPNPSALGALIYLFNGIEPTNQRWILQPVLQWASNGAFGGDYWVIASWFVEPTGYVFYSQPQVVVSGDVIRGTTGITAEGAGTIDWVVSAEDLTSGLGSYLGTASNAQLQWNWAFAGVLEAYNLSSCFQLPANTLHTEFQNTYLYHGYPNFLNANANPWSGTTYGGPSCGFFAYGFGANPGTAVLDY